MPAALMSKAPPHTLFDLTQGPGAIPVDRLVAEAEAAAALIMRDYLPFLREKLPAVSALVRDGAWAQLAHTMLDIRGSSATAGYTAISTAARSLERLLAEAPADPRRPAVARLHVEALALLTSAGGPRPGSPEEAALLEHLHRATDYLISGED